MPSLKDLTGKVREKAAEQKDAMRLMLIQRGIARVADSLDEKDLDFVAEVTADPRYKRLMKHAPEGETVARELKKELKKRRAKD